MKINIVRVHMRLKNGGYAKMEKMTGICFKLRKVIADEPSAFESEIHPSHKLKAYVSVSFVLPEGLAGAFIKQK